MTPNHFQSLLEEIAEWPLQQRRDCIAAIEANLGADEAQKIKDGLTKLWEAKSK